MLNKFLSSVIAIFLTVNGWSYHFDRSHDWNEKNNILSIELELSEEYSIEADHFINSFGDDSYFINVTRKWDIDGNETNYFGLKMGLGDGYGTGLFPVVLPVYIKRFEFFTTELVVLPMVVIFAIKIRI